MRSMQAAIRATFVVLRGPTEYVLPIIILPPPFLISYRTDDRFLCNTCSVNDQLEWDAGCAARHEQCQSSYVQWMSGGLDDIDMWQRHDTEELCRHI